MTAVALGAGCGAQRSDCPSSVSLFTGVCNAGAQRGSTWDLRDAVQRRDAENAEEAQRTHSEGGWRVHFAGLGMGSTWDLRDEFPRRDAETLRQAQRTHFESGGRFILRVGAG